VQFARCSVGCDMMTHCMQKVESQLSSVKLGVRGLTKYKMMLSLLFLFCKIV
jgi:hypothetical protein